MAKKEEIKEESSKTNIAIENFIANIDKEFGNGSVIKMDSGSLRSIKRFSSGSLSLDIALGGGWPVGRIIECMGGESSGKSTVALHAIAEVQKDGGNCIYIDAEHSFDPFYAENIGVDVKSLILNQPSSGEEGLTVLERAIKTKAFKFAVVDSVSALTPKAIMEMEMGEQKMALLARLMSQGLAKIVSAANENECTVLFINQLRSSIGSFYGPSEVTSGGNALKYYASIRCDVRKSGQEKDSDNNVTAIKTKVKVVKNKTAPPFKVAEFQIVFGEGISLIDEIIEIGVSMDIIKKSGSWYSVYDTKLGQGSDAVKILLNDNFELKDRILADIKYKLIQ